MPSGPKKRMKLRRKKQGSPADANSDKETESLSISGSVDVDELDIDDVDTPTNAKRGDRRAGSTFDDKDAVSSQTEEWVRVSDFDVGTPTSQTGENEPISEDAEMSSVRRSHDKLGEWESVSEDNIPGKKEGSINSLEEEPSEVDVEESGLEGASGHSSESFTHLPSPQLTQEKDSDVDRRSVRSDSSSSSSSSSSDARSKPSATELTESTGVGPDSEPGKILDTDFSVVKNEDEAISKSSGDPVEKEIVHEDSESPSTADTSMPDEREMKVDEPVKSEDTEPQAVDVSEGLGKDEHAALQGSIGRLEEEPSKVDDVESRLEGGSGQSSEHSSEGFTHLPSVQPVEEKDSDIDRRHVRSDSSSIRASDERSESPAAEFTESAGIGPDSEPAKILDTDASAVKSDNEEIYKSSGDPVEKEVVHEDSESPSTADTSMPDEREMKIDEAVKSEDAEPQAVDVSEGQGKEHAASKDSKVEVEPVSSLSEVTPPEADDQAENATVETISADNPVEEKEITASAAKDISEIATPLNTPAVGTPSTTEETPEEDKEVLSLKEESRMPINNEHPTGDDEKIWLDAAYSGVKPTDSGIVDVEEDNHSEDKEVASLLSDDKHEETNSSPSSEPPVTAVEDKEVASSSSAETEKAKKFSADVPDFESATTIHERKASSGLHTELSIDSVSLKPLARTSDQEEQQAVVMERHTTVDTTQPAAVKNGIATGNLRPQMEQKSALSGCCGVIYWLLGRDQ